MFRLPPLSFRFLSFLGCALAGICLPRAAGQQAPSSTSSDYPTIPSPQVPPPMPNFPDSGPGFGSGTWPRMIYFPPIPPALYVEVRRDPREAATGRFEALVAECLNEIFYPQLATRASAGQLQDKQRGELTAYLVEKTRLQKQIRAELERTAASNPAERAAALRALAKAQAPRLAALADRAEQFRQDLLIPGGDWSALREWHLDDGSRRADSPQEIALVFQSTAYFQGGLSLAQRDLLRVIALEVFLSVQPELAGTAAADQIYMQFLPAPARVAMPKDVPAELAKTLAAFESRFSHVKKELFDAIVAQDKRLAWLRRSALGTLAEKQAPDFAALEELAEQVRRGVDALPSRSRAPTVSPLPAEFDARLARLVNDRRELITTTTKKFTELNLRLEGQLVVKFNFEGTKLMTWIEDNRRPQVPVSPAVVALAASLEATVTAMAEDYTQTYAALAQEGSRLQKEVAQLPEFASPGTAAVAIGKAARAALFRQNGDPFEDYRIAVLVPGLSPAQRRLMFDSALVKLDLPMPRGNLQPIRRMR